MCVQLRCGRDRTDGLRQRTASTALHNGVFSPLEEEEEEESPEGGAQGVEDELKEPDSSIDSKSGEETSPQYKDGSTI